MKFKCRFQKCNKSFKTRYKLYKHYDDDHKEQYEVSKFVRKNATFVCKYCSNRCVSSSALRMHTSRYHKDDKAADKL